MKKIIALIIALLIVGSCFPSFASGVTVSVGDVSGKMGDVVEVPVVLSGNTGFAALGLEFGYDASALEIVEVTASSEVGATFTKAQEFSANPYNVSFDATENVVFNGTLVVLKFKIKAEAGEYPVSVSYYKGRNGTYTDGVDTNYDENFDNIGLSYVGGKITVVKDPVFAIEEYNDEGNVSFKVSLPEEKGYVVAAVYDADGRMLDVKMQSATGDKAFSFKKEGKSVKVFWVGNSLEPYEEEIEKDI